MQDHGNTNVRATPNAPAREGGVTTEPSKSDAGKASLVTTVEGWLNDPRAPWTLLGTIFLLFFVAVLSG